jgi:hypothetical protein
MVAVCTPYTNGYTHLVTPKLRILYAFGERHEGFHFVFAAQYYRHAVVAPDKYIEFLTAKHRFYHGHQLIRKHLFFFFVQCQNKRLETVYSAQ